MSEIVPPSQLNFQTFLLDKNNHVIAIGNPVHNYDVRELYIHLISGGIDGDSLSNMRTVIKIEEDMVDLGSFDWRREQHITFEIHNIGKIIWSFMIIRHLADVLLLNIPKNPFSPESL